MTGCVLSPRLLLLLFAAAANSDGKDDREEIPIPARPDRSALDRSDDKTAPVFGSRRVREPPPPPGVTFDDGFVVVTLRMYFAISFSPTCCHTQKIHSCSELTSKKTRGPVVHKLSFDVKIERELQMENRKLKN